MEKKLKAKDKKQKTMPISTVTYPTQSDYIDLKGNRTILVPKKFSYKRVKRSSDNPIESHTKLDTGLDGT